MPCLTDPTLLNSTLTDREIIDKLEELIQRERELHTLFREKRDALEELMAQINAHVKECRNFWQEKKLWYGHERVSYLIDKNTICQVRLPRGFVRGIDEEKEGYVKSFLPYGLNSTRTIFEI